MRPLVTFFLIALVAAQFEYVTDAAAFLGEHSGGGTTVQTDLADNHPDNDQDHHGCDHCCHGAGHLTGMAVYPPLTSACAVGSEEHTTKPANLSSLALTPPVPPPIA